MSTSSKSKHVTGNQLTIKHNKSSIGKSTIRSVRTRSEANIARDLRHQFDEQGLEEDAREDQRSGHSNNYAGDIEQQDQEEGKYQHLQHIELRDSRDANIPRLTDSQARHNRSIRGLSNPRVSKTNLNQYSHSNSNSKININKIIGQSREEGQGKPVQVPRSYLLALEHLQNAIEEKDTQILALKHQLMEKQEVIFGCQTQINQILLKYHQLSDSHGLKEAEIKVLKQQIQQLKRDQEITLKQAARIVQAEFKGEPLRNTHGESRAFTTFKNRSVSSNPGTFPRDPLVTAAFSKQVVIPRDQNKNLTKSNLTSNQELNGSSALASKTDGMQPHLLTARPSIVSPSSLLCSSPPIQMSEKQGNRDFVSYQRQIIRNQKQLIALKYRMECLERKLRANPKEDNVKTKIRRLSDEIQNKQRTINDLKKL